MATSSTATTSSTTVAASGRWRPVPGVSWQWQLDGEIDMEVEAEVFDVDGFDVDRRTVSALHQRGRRVVCYLSVGSAEEWRPDADRYAEEILGNPLEDWPGERWVDIRALDQLGPILTDRLDMCRDKGFDAVEADNVDAFEHDSGFPLTAQDQLRFNRWLASEAHARGLSIALKNDRSQAAELVGSFDFAIEEECFEFEECGLVQPFVDAGLAVLVAEYGPCPEEVPSGYSVIRKRMALDAWREVC